MQERDETAAAGNSEPIRISALARMSGCSVPTSRYYVYDVGAVQLLSFVRRCRDFGFSIEQTRALLALSQGKDRDCVEAQDIAQEQLNAVRAKMLELSRRRRVFSSSLRWPRSSAVTSRTFGSKGRFGLASCPRSREPCVVCMVAHSAPACAGRVYAAYGGVYVSVALL
jgi:DNA-binding transcriptional MerR regulator